MAINYASKCSPHVVERFKLGSRTEGIFSNKYDFTGVRTLTVYTNDLVTLNDYSRTGSSNRYGVPNELGDTKQTLTLAVDKGFTFSIDAGNAAEQYNIKQQTAA